jgi:hypothetical protein
LVPFVNARVGIGMASVIALVAGVVAVAAAWQLRGDVLRGHPAAAVGAVVTGTLLRPEPAGAAQTVRAIDAAPTPRPAAGPPAANPPAAGPSAQPEPSPSTMDQPAVAPPGFHVFRPTPPAELPLPPGPVNREPGEQ